LLVAATSVVVPVGSRRRSKNPPITTQSSSRYLEVRDDRPDDAAAAVPGVRGQQQAEPAVPRPLVVVDEHEDVVVAGLVERAVAGGGDAGPRLVDVPHASRRTLRRSAATWSRAPASGVVVDDQHLDPGPPGGASGAPSAARPRRRAAGAPPPGRPAAGR
jgi:hypothetical protein